MGLGLRFTVCLLSTVKPFFCVLGLQLSLHKGHLPLNFLMTFLILSGVLLPSVHQTASSG